MVEEIFDDELDETPDRFPSAVDVENVLKGYLQGGDYTIIESKSDDEGVIVFEIETTDADGLKTGYNCQRAKYDYTQASLPSSAKFSTSIHSIFYDSDGIPTGGQCVVNFRDGKWYPVS